MASASVTTATAGAPLRIAGVPEAFNDAFNQMNFASPGATFISHPGGSGAMVSSLENGSVDAAFVLTECAVAAISRGAFIRLVAPIVASPLTWGVIARHGAGLPDGAWAVSRRGSGSDVMLRVLARSRGWRDTPGVIECANFTGMRNAVVDGKAVAFLWERSTTRGLLRDDKLLDIVDTVKAPWPAFCCIVRAGCSRVQDVRAACCAFAKAAAKWHRDSATPDAIVDKHGMTGEEAREWLDALSFAAPGATFDVRGLRETRDALVRAEVIAKEQADIDIAEYII